MIRVFRKLRHELAEKQDYRKYTIYAISEVFLVVIGILIALGLNNWNQDRKEHQEEIKMLLGLHQQLGTDLIQLRDNIASTEARRDKVLKILELLDDPDNIDLSEFAILQLDLTEDDYFVSQRAIFDEAVSSGKLNLIQNDSLRQSIFQYYNAISNERDNDKLQFKVTNELIMPIMVQEVASTKEFMDVFSRSKGYNINANIPRLDLKALSKSKKYYQAIIYAMGDEYQMKDWLKYSTLAKNLIRSIKFELEYYNVDVKE